MTSSVNSVVEAWPLRSAVRTPCETASKTGLADCAPGFACLSLHVGQQRAAGQDHRHRVGHVLALSDGAVPCAASAISASGSKSSVEGDEQRLGAGDRTKER